MANPVQNKVGCIFIPVSNLEKARDWYCKLLDLPADGDIIYGHLYILPMQGHSNIVLDSKIYSPEKVIQVPFIQLVTADIEASYAYMKEHKVELLTNIENGHWFNIKDPDGNVLMICQ
ncbi:VOC family protein [Paenibacillus pinisoli]|uniref:VOC family protein n=1 Tax=Paenibacillus pinisoli TaxID=1276110 RepID=A0A3A6PQC6_9BACL|nr:VOC family protein [Paenibacillus pinisoli]RJX38073.1 VOC family protein [Paenibacillus pinisoli]